MLHAMPMSPKQWSCIIVSLPLPLHFTTAPTKSSQSAVSSPLGSNAAESSTSLFHGSAGIA
jgi:hypothetical protein